MTLDSSTSPQGYRFVPIDGRPLNHNVSFRVTAEEGARLLALRDTFNPAQWGSVMRWLLNEPRVEAVIRERIEANLT